MAAAEIETGARLFYRKPEDNTYGVLNVREDFATANPDIVRRVLATYETARKWSASHPAELNAALVAAAHLPEPVIARQLQRTDLSSGRIGETQAATIIAAGKALQTAGILDNSVDIVATTNGLIDPSYGLAIGA
jgi:sulfonate transport system substrate-binding protein